MKAKLSNIRIAPRKMRLVADLCRGMMVDQAKIQLHMSPKRGSEAVSKLLKSAVANALDKGGVDESLLYVKEIRVDQGPTMKRFMPRAMGRATQIQKKTSHVFLTLDEKR